LERMKRTTIETILLVLTTFTFFGLQLLVAEALSSLDASPVRRVVVVGGTHGNEYTGVWCIKALELQKEELRDRYPSMEIETLLANPQAHLANRRFIDTDLNREFQCDTLCIIDDDDDIKEKEENRLSNDDSNTNDGGEELLHESIEYRRAKELDLILGSKCKFGSSDEEDEFDVAIDLHSTTSNMGITLIINEGDHLMTQAAAFVATHCQPEHEVRILMHSIPERENRSTLSSAAKHGFTIEVGPVPQGILRHDAVQKTDAAMHGVLEFLQRIHNREEDTSVGVRDEMRRWSSEAYPTGRVPCFRTAPARRPGEISGKITWPCDPDNPNFPSLMVHESLQDQDFSLLRVGDPLFVAPDRSVVYYDGSHGESVYVVFVNEGGYYYASSGTGIGVAVTAEYDLQTGMLCKEKKLEYEKSNTL